LPNNQVGGQVTIAQKLEPPTANLILPSWQSVVRTIAQKQNPRVRLALQSSLVGVNGTIVLELARLIATLTRR